jgi:hypothetical protein
VKLLLPSADVRSVRAPEGGKFLYLLVDPRTGETRWVGIATFPVLRLRRHCLPEARDCNPEKAAWVEELLLEGYQPVMVLLAVLPATSILAAEAALMEKLREHGEPLLNRTPRMAAATGYADAAEATA